MIRLIGFIWFSHSGKDKDDVYFAKSIALAEARNALRAAGIEVAK